MIKGCPPRRDNLIEVFGKLRIKLPENPNVWIDNIPSYFLQQYDGKPEFDESFFKVSSLQ
jgi:hypothetical protein